jgi:hypothetical protein
MWRDKSGRWPAYDGSAFARTNNTARTAKTRKFLMPSTFTAGFLGLSVAANNAEFTAILPALSQKYKTNRTPKTDANVDGGISLTP